MGMGFAATWLRQVSPAPPASQNHVNHWSSSSSTRSPNGPLRRSVAPGDLRSPQCR